MITVTQSRQQPLQAPRDKSMAILSNQNMEVNPPCDTISFTLSKPAQEYLQALLPDWIEQMSQRQLVPTLSFSGAESTVIGGKVTWTYRGPLFCVAGQKREKL